MGKMEDAPAECLAAQGAVSSPSVVRHRARLVRSADERDGSRDVFRRELTRSLAREPRVAVGPGARMSEDELRQAALRAYPDYQVTGVFFRKNPDQAAEICLERRDKKLQRLFDPYTGADLGDSIRRSFRFVLWLVDLHDNLLLAKTGRLLNAAGGIFTVLSA